MKLTLNAALNPALGELNYLGCMGCELAVMTGQTEINVFEPFPAGGVFVHRPGSLTNYWRHSDWLGGSRFASTESGAAKFFDVGYAPYGEDYSDSGTTDLFFTGKNKRRSRAQAAYTISIPQVCSAAGTFHFSEPAGGDPANPQSFNKYAYMNGNPLAGVDPTGLLPADDSRNFFGTTSFGFDAFGGDCTTFLIPCDTGNFFRPFGIFEQENSVNFPAPGLLSTLGDNGTGRLRIWTMRK